MGWLINRLEEQLDILCEDIEATLPLFASHSTEDLCTALERTHSLKERLVEWKHTAPHSLDGDRHYYLRSVASNAYGFIRVQALIHLFDASQPAYSPEQQYCLASLDRLAQHVYRPIHMIRPELYNWFTDLHQDEELASYAVPVSHLLTSPYLHNQVQRDRLQSRADESLSSASVQYDPLKTPFFLQALMETLPRQQRNVSLHVSPQADADGIALSITQTHLMMRPERWNELLAHQHLLEIEHLYEIGGSLEPLTWDEGYGQGVVLRLPWADPQRRLI